MYSHWCPVVTRPDYNTNDTFIGWRPNPRLVSKKLGGSWFSTPAAGECAGEAVRSRQQSVVPCDLWVYFDTLLVCQRPGDGSGCTYSGEEICRRQVHQFAPDSGPIYEIFITRSRYVATADAEESRELHMSSGNSAQMAFTKPLLHCFCTVSSSV